MELKLHIIGVGTGGEEGARVPQYFSLETLLIFMHAAQIAAIAVYITHMHVHSLVLDISKSIYTILSLYQ